MIPRKNEYPARHRAGVVKNRKAECASPKGLSCFISPSLFKPFSLAFIYIIYTYASHHQPSTIYHNFTRFTLSIRSTIHSAKTLQNISETESGKYRIIVIFYRIPFCIFTTIFYHFVFSVPFKTFKKHCIFIVFPLISCNLLIILLNFALFRKYS